MVEANFLRITSNVQIYCSKNIEQTKIENEKSLSLTSESREECEQSCRKPSKGATIRYKHSPEGRQFPLPGEHPISNIQLYTHLDVQVTRKFSKNISEQIL